MKCTIVTIGSLDTHAYPLLKNWFPTFDFRFVLIPPTLFPTVKYGDDWYGLDYKALRDLGHGGDLVQFLYDPIPYNRKMYSNAQFSPKGQTQYSQVVYPTIYTEPLHEIIHSLYNFFGVPDRLHQLIKENNSLAEPAIRAALAELDIHIIKEKETMEKPLWPLPARIPIFGAGYNAWRTLKGKRVRHQAQDYVGRDWTFRAPEDGVVAAFTDPEGGRMFNFVGKLYDYQVAHLKTWLKTGQVKRGEDIAICNNSGTNTSNPHCHLALKAATGGDWIDPESIAWEEEYIFMQLIRNSKGEISLFTGKLRHPVSAKSYADYLDSAPFIQVTDEFYNSIPVGKALAGSQNLGEAVVVEDPQDGTDVTP